MSNLETRIHHFTDRHNSRCNIGDAIDVTIRRDGFRSTDVRRFRIVALGPDVVKPYALGILETKGEDEALPEWFRRAAYREKPNAYMLYSHESKLVD